MKAEENKLIFATGKTIYVERGFVGISPGLDVGDGFDSLLSHHYSFLPEESVELAEYMINLWTEYLHKLKPNRYSVAG